MIFSVGVVVTISNENSEVVLSNNFDVNRRKTILTRK
jgi:hypothetical protein